MDENARINGAETRRVDVKAPNIVQVLIIILFFFFFSGFFSLLFHHYSTRYICLSSSRSRGEFS